ncbi:hypothetical protein NQ314_004201 [Rhamnusium bicolor]|uniref:PiggyBac transposable element-derived protein domain-containing protein n=1 Tax=Rhamnusium bicolor TaxID=1586634 RepID=A0AAV8ZMX6_9CUCU|nr:hypothetical protein NQ314_004201 [Rhamnusium bicolor]
MDSIYHHSLFHRVPMSYNRFVLLLKCWHFANNEGQDGTRTYKIRPLLNMMMQRTKDLYKPGDTVVVDETMIPFRGRLSFRQYNPSKASRYGIKLYKVCTPEGFTYSTSIYDGKSEKLPDLDLPGSTVVNLTRDLFGEGRLIITDNYYTSLHLAKYLYNKKNQLDRYR